MVVLLSAIFLRFVGAKLLSELENQREDTLTITVRNYWSNQRDDHKNSNACNSVQDEQNLFSILILP